MESSLVPFLFTIRFDGTNTILGIFVVFKDCGQDLLIFYFCWPRQLPLGSHLDVFEFLNEMLMLIYECPFFSTQLNGFLYHMEN